MPETPKVTVASCCCPTRPPQFASETMALQTLVRTGSLPVLSASIRVRLLGWRLRRRTWLCRRLRGRLLCLRNLAAPHPGFGRVLAHPKAALINVRKSCHRLRVAERGGFAVPFPRLRGALPEAVACLVHAGKPGCGVRFSELDRFLVQRARFRIARFPGQIGLVERPEAHHCGAAAPIGGLFVEFSRLRVVFILLRRTRTLQR